MSFAQNSEKKNKLQEIVQSGIYLIQLDNIDVKNQTFRAEFYLNFKWKGHRSANNFELLNAIQYTKHFYSEWNEGGYNYLSCKIRGMFRSNMDVTDFPFDAQSLKIKIRDYVWIEDSLNMSLRILYMDIQKNFQLQNGELKIIS